MSMLNKKMISICMGIFLCIWLFKAFAGVESPRTNKAKDISGSLTNSYDNPNSKFSIQYPKDWIYDDATLGVVVFSGKKDTPQYYSTIDIQTVKAKKYGGEYQNIKVIIDDIKQQVLKESPQTTFLNHGPIEIAMKNESKLKGEFLIFIYSYKGNIIEQWQVIIPRKDQSVFYTWAYTAPIDQYAHDLPIAKAMLASWLIY